MRLFILLSGLSSLLLSSGECSLKKNFPPPTIYHGRLEVAGICSNYTIKMLNPVDTSLVVANWTNEATGISYTNVFRLDKPCFIPSWVKEGAEFDFYIDSTSTKICTVCLAYYPTPPKKLAITIVDKK